MLKNILLTPKDMVLEFNQYDGPDYMVCVLPEQGNEDHRRFLTQLAESCFVSDEDIAIVQIKDALVPSRERDQLRKLVQRSILEKPGDAGVYLVIEPSSNQMIYRKRWITTIFGDIHAAMAEIKGSSQHTLNYVQEASIEEPSRSLSVPEIIYITRTDLDARGVALAKIRGHHATVGICHTYNNKDLENTGLVDLIATEQHQIHEVGQAILAQVIMCDNE